MTATYRVVRWTTGHVAGARTELGTVVRHIT
jgi:hypothetical protein